jgi:maltooligosyltrehalose trehalohydrolase
MVFCLQNHDQIGNRAFGTRLHHQIEPALFRALSALLLFAPETPLLFMGQEWAASTPFLYFTDHHEALGPLVTEGRRQEFSRFEAFASEETRARIPDPQALGTFEASRLNWAECIREPHAGMLELYRALLDLRRTEPALGAGSLFHVIELDEAGLALSRSDPRGRAMLLVVWLEGSGVYEHGRRMPITPGGRWEVVLSTEEARFQQFREEAGTFAPRIELGESPIVSFRRPSAVVLRRE